MGSDPATIRAKRLNPDSGSDITPSLEIVGDATIDRQEPAVAWNADAGRWLEMVLFADDFETGNTSRWSLTAP